MKVFEPKPQIKEKSIHSVMEAFLLTAFLIMFSENMNFYVAKVEHAADNIWIENENVNEKDTKRKSFSNLRMTNEVQIHLKIFIIIAPFGRNRVPEDAMRVYGYENEMKWNRVEYKQHVHKTPISSLWLYISKHIFNYLKYHSYLNLHFLCL